MNRRPISLFWAATAGIALVFPSALAQTWPAHTIRMIQPAAPGSTADAVGRALMEPVSRSLGVPVVTEYRVGADGIIGMEACAKAPADGHTLCMTGVNVIVWNPVRRINLPYDPLRDLIPVIHVGFFDSALIATPSLSASNVKELIALAQANPGKVTWGHTGVQSTGYMYEGYLKKSLNAPFFLVPYKSPPQAMLAILSGEVQVGIIALPIASPHLKSARVKALAVTADKRVDFLPLVPTFAEEGIKLPLRVWIGYHYPIGTPRAQVLRMNGEIRTAMAAPEVKEKIIYRIGLVSNTGTPEEFDAYIRAEMKSARELVTFLGLKPE